MSYELIPSETMIVDRYKVIGEPLFGGMGIVYLCEDACENRPIALKTFRPEFLPDRDARDRFLRECSAWIELGAHPHIVQAYGAFIDPRNYQIYLVLELVAKNFSKFDASLRSWLVPGRRMPAELALLFGLQIIRGMAHAGRVLPGFVHRDLKPENILVGADKLTNAEVNRVRVTDFGLLQSFHSAGQSDKHKTQQGFFAARRAKKLTQGVMGTPQYMAPEQWFGGELGPFTDIYAFGCVFYEMLTGYPIVAEGQLSHIKTSHCQGVLTRLPVPIPVKLQELLTGCLATSPYARISRWQDLEKELSRAYMHITDKPVPESEPFKAAEKINSVEKALALNEIGMSYLHIGKPAEALPYFSHVRDHGRTGQTPYLDMIGALHIGLAHLDLGQPREAIKYFEQTLSMARSLEEADMVGAALNNLGLAFRHIGQTAAAIDYHTEALHIAQAAGDIHSECKALGCLGVAYKQSGKFEQAISCYEQALHIARKLASKVDEIPILNNLGVANSHLEKYEKAIEYFEQALSLAQALGDRRGEGGALGNIGKAYRKMKNFGLAIQYLKQALLIAQEINSLRDEATSVGNLGLTYMASGDYEQAIVYLSQSYKLNIDTNNYYEAACDLNTLAVLHSEFGRYSFALNLAEESVAIFEALGRSEVHTARHVVVLLRAKLDSY